MMERAELLAALNKLLPAQFEEVLFRLEIPPGYLSAPGTAQTTRAMELIRYIEAHGSLSDVESMLPRSTSKVKILFMSASPVDAKQLRIGEEVRDIDRRLVAGRMRDRFHLEQAWAETTESLSETLLRHRPTLLHFSGHGSKSGRGIAFQDERTNKAALVGGEMLARLFRVFASRGLRGVFLNACYTAPQSTAIVEHVDFVVGIEGEIGNAGACAFSVGFYTALVNGETVQNAVELGCIQMGLLNQAADAKLIKLLVRAGLDAAKLRL